MKIAVITPRKKADALASLIIDGLYSTSAELVVSDLGNGVKEEDVMADDDFIEYAKSADFIFVLWGKGPDDRWDRSAGNMHPKYYLLDKIQRPEVTVFVDGSEWTSTGHPETYDMIEIPCSRGRKIPKQVAEAKMDPDRCRGEPWINEDLRKKCQWYFKRECYPEDTLRGIIPLNVGCSDSFFGDPDSWNKDRPVDIFCSFGQVYTGLRYEVEDVCKKLKSEGFNVKIITDEKLSHEEYLKTMAESKISVSAWGAGNSCMRMWESMANGACCFAQRTEILFPNKPQDGFHYIEYSAVDEFERKIREYLKNEELCREIGKRGQAFTMQHHTGQARIMYMFQIIGAGNKSWVWYDLEKDDK